MRSRGGGCTISSLAVAGRRWPPLPARPPSPKSGFVTRRLRPSLGPRTAAPRRPAPSPRRSRAAFSGAGGDHVPAGEAQWVSHARGRPRGWRGRPGRGPREPPSAHEGDRAFPVEAAAATWQPHAGWRRQQRRRWRRFRPLGWRRPAHRLAQHQPHARRRQRERGRAHQPHRGHADGRVRDVHARYQPHSWHSACGPKQSSATAAATAPAGHRVVAQLVAHPPVARRGECGPTPRPRPPPEEVPRAGPALGGEEEPQRPGVQSRYVEGRGPGARGMDCSRAPSGRGWACSPPPLRRVRAGRRGRGGAAANLGPEPICGNHKPWDLALHRRFCLHSLEGEARAGLSLLF